jgi:hypothetical protein
VSDGNRANAQTLDVANVRRDAIGEDAQRAHDLFLRSELKSTNGPIWVMPMSRSTWMRSTRRNVCRCIRPPNVFWRSRGYL